MLEQGGGFVGQSGLKERVVLLGTLSRGEVSWVMEKAAVFVLPSRVEPFGIVNPAWAPWRGLRARTRL